MGGSSSPLRRRHEGHARSVTLHACASLHSAPFGRSGHNGEPRHSTSRHFRRRGERERRLKSGLKASKGNLGIA